MSASPVGTTETATIEKRSRLRLMRASSVPTGLNHKRRPCLPMLKQGANNPSAYGAFPPLGRCDYPPATGPRQTAPMDSENDRHARRAVDATALSPAPRRGECRPIIEL